MAWLLLLLSAIFEIGFVVLLRQTGGFTHILPTVLFACSGLTAVVLLQRALRTIPLSIGYAVWTGIGVLGTSVWGMMFFGESANLLRLVFLFTLTLALVGLRFVAPPKE